MTLSGQVINYLTKSDLVQPKATFRLVRVNLMRAACPRELKANFGNQVASSPIVIVKNRYGYGLIESTGYKPGAVMVAGSVRRNFLADEGRVHDYAWVEQGALEINADDEISTEELMDKLYALLTARIFGAKPAPIAGPWPAIVKVYAFENYFIYCYQGQKYRQTYSLDPVARSVKLSGGAVAVNEKFINAGEAKMSMPLADTGAHYQYAPTMGNTQSMTRGAPNSELIHSIVRNWADINEAVGMYLAAIKFGLVKPMKPAFSPAPDSMVTQANMPEIASKLAAAGVTLYEFAKWSIKSKAANTKSHSGQDVTREKHAFVGDPSDPSTWKLPIHDEPHIKNALARINQTQGIPANKKAGVLNKIRRAASNKGIGVSKEPTGGQKQWVKHKQAASVGFEGEQVREQKQAAMQRQGLRV